MKREEVFEQVAFTSTATEEIYVTDICSQLFVRFFINIVFKIR